jgi:hypothetical protein
MIPRLDATYHKLPGALKNLYLSGIPREYLADETRQFNFKNEKTSQGVLTSTIQKDYFKRFLEVPPGEQGLTLFNSAPSDHEALQFCCHVLKHHFKQGFGDFEFVTPYESIPYDPDLVKSLYIITGVNVRDEQATHRVRLWCRTALGSSIWVVVSGPNPVQWASEMLNVKPQFLFALKPGGVSVG